MINNLPHYTSDETTGLPNLVLPVNIKRDKPKKYLGDRYTKGDLTVSLSYFAKNADEMKALYNFYNIDCNGGSSMFTLNLNIFGIGTGKFAVEWVSDFKSDCSSAITKTGQLTLLVKYVVDEYNELIAISNY